MFVELLGSEDSKRAIINVDLISYVREISHQNKQTKEWSVGVEVTVNTGGLHSIAVFDSRSYLWWMHLLDAISAGGLNTSEYEPGSENESR